MGQVIPLRQNVHFSSSKQDWETPPDLFRELDREFHFTLDVCATADNAKCKRFLSPKENALHPFTDWTGMCWMNPPYGREIIHWVKKACYSAGNGTTVVCLLPARTDTRWWHEYVIPGSKEIRFLRGRIRFVGAKASAPFPSAIVVFSGVV